MDRVGPGRTGVRIPALVPPGGVGSWVSASPSCSSRAVSAPKGKAPDLDDIDAGWEDEEEEDVDAGWGEGPEAEEPEEPEPAGMTPEERAERAARLVARAEERKQRQRAKAAEKAERRKARAAAAAAKQKKSARKPGSSKPRPERAKPVRAPREVAEESASPRARIREEVEPVRRVNPRRPWLPTAILIAILVVAGGVAFWLYRR